MAIVNDIIKKFFGNKSDRDIKVILPMLAKIREEYAKLGDLTNDQLRAKTLELKQIIREHIKTEEDKIASLRQRIETEKPEIDEVEKIYDEIDKIEKEIDTKLEDVLNKILPEAFAIVKETARRFNDNEYLEATRILQQNATVFR